jgi:hypothetical protein
MTAWNGCLGCLLRGCLRAISGFVYQLRDLVPEPTYRVQLDLLNGSITRGANDLHDLS